MKNYKFLIGVFSVVFVVLGFVNQVRAELIYGMTAFNSQGTSRGVGLVSFDSATPGTITTIGNFTGVVANHQVRSMDFRPANGQLYAISTDLDTFNTGQLYTVNLSTAALTPVGPGFVLGTNADFRVEMDFNPSVDRIRVITGATKQSGQTNNFRVNPNTGVLVVSPSDTSLAFAATDPNFNIDFNQIAAAAYSNNIAGATTTTLYAWDFGTSDSLVRIGSVGGSPISPNSGSIFTIQLQPPGGELGFNSGIGMDISGVSGICYVTHDNPAPLPGTLMSLFTRNLTSGAETKIGNYPASTFISDISVKTPNTAAGVTVSGRLITAEGRGIINARVSLTNPDGSVSYAISRRGGYYQFDDVEVGATYIFTVQSRRYQFDNPTRVISLTDAIADLDFIAISTNRERLLDR